MFSSVGKTTVNVAPEVTNKKSDNTGTVGKGSARLETAEEPLKETGKVATHPEIKKTGDDSVDNEKKEVMQGEIRNIDIRDGELITKVYDSDGKLLRVTPPGYLPANERKFDVII